MEKNINLTIEELYELSSLLSTTDIFLPANLSNISDTKKKEFYFEVSGEYKPHPYNTKLSGYKLPEVKFNWLLELIENKKNRLNNELQRLKILEDELKK